MIVLLTTGDLGGLRFNMEIVDLILLYTKTLFTHSSFYLKNVYFGTCKLCNSRCFA